MSDNQWKPGDLVGVKSGGPTMTVAGESQLGMVICEWFDGKKQMSGTFNAAVLVARLSHAEAVSRMADNIRRR
jgi:uncharacterized protein YodC (DUF2158 family)